MIKVIVSGANGRMGREVVKAVSSQEDMKVVAAFDSYGAGVDAGTLAGIPALGIIICDRLDEVLATEADIVVDFTIAAGFEERAAAMLDAGKRIVAGTTGLTDETLGRVAALAAEKKLGVLVAPNFAIGAVLMMQFATKAIEYIPHAEVIELHHDKKLDAPSGTALATAEMLRQARDGQPEIPDPTKVFKVDGVRGGRVGDIQVHSVRLPGFIASQEILFGAQGQFLTIRHDTTSREAFMPGVLLAVRRMMEIDTYVFGLDKIM